MVIARPAPRPVDTDQGFRTLIDSLPVGMMWLDRNGDAVDWNLPAEVILTSSAGPRLEEAIARLHACSMETGGCVQALCELSGSERLSISVSPDRVPHVSLVVLDRKKLEKARNEVSVLREVLKAIASSESRRDAVQRALSTVHASMPLCQLAFFELDKRGHQFSCAAFAGVCESEAGLREPIANDTDRSLLAVAVEQAKPFHVSDASAVARKLPFAVPTGTSALLMSIGRRGSSGVLYVSALTEALGEGVLRVLQALADAIGALQDLVTLEAEAVRAREVAAQRDRLATIGQLVAGVAHEINNPLAFLKSNLSTLKADVVELMANNEVAEVEEIVTESLEGVARIETIVQALKGTARKTQEKIRFDAGRAVREAVTIFRGAKKAECEVDLVVEPLSEVVGSPSAIGQVVLNLLQNGLDAMSGSERKARRLRIRAWGAERKVHFSVRDCGTGIPPEVQRRMYDAFFTTKDPGKGTGLGLYICRDLIEGMGGALRFTTGSDGTTFECELPAAAEE